MLLWFVFIVEYVFFFKQKTAYDMRISDWSSDVCSSDLLLSRVAESLAFAQRLVDTNAGYFAQYPAIGEMVKSIGKLDRNYVSHEYFNRHWQPESFSEVSDRKSVV